MCEQVDGPMCPRGGGAGKSEKELDLATWQMAWDGYALAAAAVGQMTFQSASCHKRVILEVACNGAAEGRSTLLGVLYCKAVRSVLGPGWQHVLGDSA